MFRQIKPSYLIKLVKRYSTKVEIDVSLREGFESTEFKPRKHPGKVRLKIAAIPPDIQKSINIILEDSSAKSQLHESEKLSNYLYSRLLPPEDGDIDLRASKLYHAISKQMSPKNRELTLEAEENVKRKVEVKVFNHLKKKVYSWGSIDYNKSMALQYLIARAAPEYAVLLRILDEIRLKFPDYKPRSFFDFGSGVGTGTWAVNTYWNGDIYEYFCVDTSSDMHDLARLILCKGRDNVELPIKGYFQRQFLPASSNLRYNIVLSAFSLFELPSMQSRLETVQKLWNKTEDFLIIVEQGTNAGFKIVNEAREFVLNLGNRSKGYAFSPCPNDSVCPRYLELKTPCNFLMKYEPLEFPKNSEPKGELFTYVILKRGSRPADDPQWRRVVRAPIVRSGHTICRLCTGQGELKEIIFSKSKYDKTTYRCARSSNWGDLLPVK